MLKGVCRRANPSLELGMTLPPLLLLHCTEAAGNQIPPALARIIHEGGLTESRAEH